MTTEPPSGVPPRSDEPSSAERWVAGVSGSLAMALVGAVFSVYVFFV